MGLAGPKKDTKISADPRNTHWASNTDRFGHRILEQYGWKPGSTLGDTTSAHHAHLTSASHTGIKVMIKDDVLGIGAKKKSEDHECTGLDVFQDLLGRLNGKDEEEVQRGREARENNRREVIVGERYRMRFVLGEVYQSSDIEQLLRKKRGREVKAEAKEEMKVKVELEDDGVAMKPERLKMEIVDEEVEEERKKKKSRKRKTKEENVDEEEEKRRRKKEKKDKKGKGEKKDKRKDRESKTSEATIHSDESEESLPSRSKGSKKDKEAKESSKDRKEKKKKMKEKREKRDKKDKKMQKESTEFSPDNSREEDTPEVATVAAAARTLTGRRAIRHKYIAAKRSAVMDVQALNEIFMIKA